MKKLKHILSVSIILMLMMSLLSACADTEEKSVSDTRFIMGTIISITLYGTEDETILEEAYTIIGDVEQTMSLNIEDTEVMALNEASGSGPVKVSEDLFYVISKAVEYGELSGGNFDISLEPVIDLWSIGSEDAKVPSEDELSEALSFVDYSKILLDTDNQTVEMPEGMSIDLGGIAKGYAADLVADYLKNEGVEKAILDLGGNVLVVGEKAENTNFRVGLRNPLGSANDYFAIVDVSDQTVVTSGVYERNYTEDGITYHHILSPEDGYPVNNGVVSVSVIADSSIDADALSTVLFMEGIDNGLILANSLDGIECIYVDETQQVYLSDGVLDLFELVDGGFEVQ